MYGWRGRVGLILPPDNTVIEPELAQIFPKGVQAFSVRLSTLDREGMIAQAFELGPPALKMIGSKLVAYCCAASSFFKGIDAEQTLVKRLEEVYEMPAITASGAMVAAIRKIGARKVALLTPYSKKLTSLLVDFLQKNGIELTTTYSLEIPTLESNYQTPEVAYKELRQMDVEGAEAILISSTAFRTLEILDLAKQDIGLPVISSNLALAWEIIERLGISRLRGNASFDSRQTA
jgi:maleate cis-trans isomerase